MMRTLLCSFMLIVACQFAYGQCAGFITATTIDSNVTCNGGSDGIATTIPSNGTTPYVYSWDNGETGQSAFNLSAGAHIVTVTDAIGCAVTSLFFVNEPPMLTTTVQTNGATCTGNTGTATVFATGGTTPYVYQWSNGAIGPTIGGLPQGTYTVTVTDANGCASTDTFIIVGGQPITVTPQNVVDDLCGQCIGMLEVVAFGGTPPFMYSIDGGNTTQASNSFTNLCAGTYVLSVIDANGCVEILTILIDDTSNLLSLGVTLVNDVTCSGINDGSATASVTGGVPPYSYIWDSGETTQTATNLEAGVHFVEMFDTNNCSTFDTITIADSGVDFNVTTTMTSCNTNDGSAAVTFTTPLTNPGFMWSNGATTQTISGLATDWYSVTVVNLDNGCRSKQILEVIEDPSCVVTIEGYVYLDNDFPDCVQDAGTAPFPNKLVVISNGTDSTYTMTDATGYYSFEGEVGNYTVRLVEVSFQELACVGSYTNAVSAPVLQTTYQGGDFYLKLIPNVNLAINLYSGPARPGFIRSMGVSYCNFGSDTISGTFSVVHDPMMAGFNGNGLEDSYNPATNTIFWSYTDLAPGACRSLSFSFLVPVGTPLGTQLCDTAYIEPLIGDIQPSNNVDEYCRTVTGSYDPNDKQNLTGIDPFGGDIYEEDNTFLYQVRFQNTGTDTAFTVVIKDTLDANLNVESFQALSASHNYEVRFTDANIVEFWFENIMLPDSNVNEPASNGLILFSIDRQPGLPIGSMFSNRAGIYFDFNPPIMTNTVVNILALPPTSIITPLEADLTIAAFPNPASEIVMLDIDIPELGLTRVSVYDYSGRLVSGDIFKADLPKGNQQLEIPTGDLVDGVYFVRVQTGDSFGVVRVSIIH